MGGYISNDIPKEDIENPPAKNRYPTLIRSPKVFFNEVENFQIEEERTGIETVENYGIIPSDILDVIFQFSSVGSILECSCSCKLFFSIIQCQTFWKRYYMNYISKTNIVIDKNSSKKNINWKKKFFDSVFSFKGKSEYYRNLFFKNKGDPSVGKLDYDFLFKIIMVGDMGAGKSSLMLRFAENSYSDGFRATIGVDFKYLRADYETNMFALQLWDTAGEERFRTITTSYYRRSHGILVLFDISKLDSFEGAKRFYEEATKYGSKYVQILFVGCKCDLKEKRTVTIKMVEKYFVSLGLSLEEDYCECSSKDNLYCDLPYGMILEKIMRKGPDGDVKKKNE